MGRKTRIFLKYYYNFVAVSVIEDFKIMQNHIQIRLSLLIFLLSFYNVIIRK